MQSARRICANNRPETTYVFTLASALRVGEHATIGTFALDGPERCSGLPVMRTTQHLLERRWDQLSGSSRHDAMSI
jgi:hypothetical protein